jgi:hypothetical protein
MDSLSVRFVASQLGGILRSGAIGLECETVGVAVQLVLWLENTVDSALLGPFPRDLLSSLKENRLWRNPATLGGSS